MKYKTSRIFIIAFYLLSIMAYRIAALVIEDMYFKIEMFGIDAASTPRHLITKGIAAFGGIDNFAFFLTLSPWLITCAVGLVRSVNKIEVYCLNLFIALLACGWLSALDAIIGRPAVMARMVHEGLSFWFLLSLSLFGVAEILVVWRTWKSRDKTVDVGASQ